MEPWAPRPSGRQRGSGRQARPVGSTAIAVGVVATHVRDRVCESWSDRHHQDPDGAAACADRRQPTQDRTSVVGRPRRLRPRALGRPDVPGRNDATRPCDPGRATSVHPATPRAQYAAFGRDPAPGIVALGRARTEALWKPQRSRWDPHTPAEVAGVPASPANRRKRPSVARIRAPLGMKGSGVRVSTSASAKRPASGRFGGHLAGHGPRPWRAAVRRRAFSGASPADPILVVGCASRYLAVISCTASAPS
jgi:hypothetical protein